MTRALQLMVSTMLAGAASAALAQTAPAPAPSLPSVAATAESAPTRGPGIDSPVVVATPGGPLILGAAEAAGIEVYDATGKRTATHAVGDIRALDARAGATGAATLVAALDGKANAVKLFALDAKGGLAPLALYAPAPGMTATGLCLAKSARDDTMYLFLLSDTGGIAQYALVAKGAGYAATLARNLSLGSETGFCAADDRGSVYISQEVVGVWRLAVEPEAEVVPQIVDIVRLGHITEEAKGVAVAPDGRLVVSDASADRLNLYDPESDFAYLGSVAIGPGTDTIDAVTDPGGVAASGGLLVVADDDNAPDKVNLKIAPWASVLTAAKLAPRDTPAAPPRLPNIVATVETLPVETGGDAADDPAIWIHPTDPAKSIVIATQKQSGLYVYDMAGKPIQFLPDGRMNNVDLRDGVRLGGRTVTLVAASDRTHKSIALYTLDPATRLLSDAADGVQATGLDDPYGLCLYKSAKSGKTYVFVNQGDGKMRQWELVGTTRGKVRARLVRDLPFASQVEGCVADDETGMLYVGEEDVGLWRMGAEPKGGPPRTMFAAAKDNPALKDDMEGIGLVRLSGGRGYLIVSSQGNDSYAVFRREGDNAYVASFAVGANAAAGIDGISETDGLDVTNSNAGPGFEGGMMVAQDGRNVSPPANQNFKFVPWAKIAAALKLDAK